MGRPVRRTNGAVIAAKPPTSATAVVSFHPVNRQQMLLYSHAVESVRVCCGCSQD